MISLLTAMAGLAVARISAAASQARLFRSRINRVPVLKIALMKRLHPARTKSPRPKVVNQWCHLERFPNCSVRQARVERRFSAALTIALYFASAAEVTDLSGGSGFVFRLRARA